MRVMLPAVRSVTQRKLSGPQVTSHGLWRPVTSTLSLNCCLPATTEPGPSWASPPIEKQRAARTTAAVTGSFMGALHFGYHLDSEAAGMFTRPNDHQTWTAA